MEYISGEIRQIDPVTAERMLWHVNEEFQRDLSPLHVRHLARIMADEYFLTGHVVIADVADERRTDNLDGQRRIANGQHTLHAIVKFGHSVRCLVERYSCDGDDDYLRLFHSYDTENKKRTYNDSAKAFLMSGEVGVSEATQTTLNMVRSGLECLWKLSSHTSVNTSKLTRHEKFVEAAGHPGVLRLVCDLEQDIGKHNRPLLHRAGVIAAIAITFKANSHRACEFWKQVISGWYDCEKGNDDYPPIRLNKFLLSHSMQTHTKGRNMPGETLTQSACYSACVYCWNAYMKGANLKVVRSNMKRKGTLRVLSTYWSDHARPDQERRDAVGSMPQDS